MANAVGAAIANVSGEIDTIEILQGKSLDATLERIKQEAIQKAVDAGADPETTRIAEINVLPVQVCISILRLSLSFICGDLVRHESSYAYHHQSYW